jgi:ubiquinone/menaquinone biosynthesis C-methylase UbiE
VLEVGAGTGANFGMLASDVDWIGLEPEARDTEELRRAAARRGFRREPLVASCEAIPLPDSSVNGVLCTLVLCSVEDQLRALAEIIRVLRPGGSLVFVEHVAAPPRTLLRWVQRLATPVSSRFDRGCHLARETVDGIRQSGLDIEELHEYRMPSGLGFTIPFAAGRAVKRAASAAERSET